MEAKPAKWIFGLVLACIFLGYIAANVPESFRAKYFGAERGLSPAPEVRETGEPIIVTPPLEAERPDANQEDIVVGRTDLDSAAGSEVIIETLVGKQVGDIVRVRVPQESALYEGTVEEVEIGSSGATHLVGNFDFEGVAYRFVFTVGKTATFGTFTTPHDRYQYQALNGQGRLVSVTEINRKRDYSKPDYVIPEPVTTRN